MTSIISTLQNLLTGLFGEGGAIPTFWNFLTGADVLPYFLIGVAVPLILLGVKLVKGIFWGV